MAISKLKQFQPEKIVIRNSADMTMAMAVKLVSIAMAQGKNEYNKNTEELDYPKHTHFKAYQGVTQHIDCDTIVQRRTFNHHRTFTVRHK